MLGLTCHRCAEPGHGWRECQRPGAKNQQELDARITDILIRWDAGKGGFGRTVKNEIIAAERNAFKPGKGKAA